MPILIVLVALLTPRLFIVLVWLLTRWFDGVFHTALWPVLGFILLPTSLLWYSAVQKWFGGEWNAITIGVMVIAVLIDCSPATGKRGRRNA